MARAAVPRSTPPRRVTRSQSRELDDQSGIAFSKAAAKQGSSNAKASSSREFVTSCSALSFAKSCDRAGIYAPSTMMKYNRSCFSLVVVPFFGHNSLLVFAAYDAAEMNDTF
jgi:hypothetical protein